MPMRLNTTVRYATRIMLSLAARGAKDYVPTSLVAKEQEISTDYAEQILRKLRLAGLVESNKGPAGGFKLAKDPSTIKISDIVNAVQGKIHLVRCLEPNGEKHCHRASFCAARLLWQRLGKMTEDFLSALTLADILKEAKELLYQKAPSHPYPYVI